MVGEVEEHPVELLAVGFDAEAAVDIVDPASAPGADLGHRLAHLGEQVAQVEALQVALRRPLAGELPSLGAEVQGTVARADQGGRPGDRKSVASGKSVSVIVNTGGRTHIKQNNTTNADNNTT